MMGGSGQSGNPNAAGGQLGQMANPQTKDPMQNLNRQGAPNFKGPAQQAAAQQPWSFNQNYDPSKPTGVGNWRRLPNQPAQQADRLAPPPMRPIPAGGGQKPGSPQQGRGPSQPQDPRAQELWQMFRNENPNRMYTQDFVTQPDGSQISREGLAFQNWMQQFGRGQTLPGQGPAPAQPTGGGK